MNHANILGHISQTVTAMREDLGSLRVEMTRRFDQAAAVATRLHERVEAIETRLQQEHNFGRMRVDITALRVAVDDLGPRFDDTQQHVDQSISAARVLVEEEIRRTDQGLRARITQAAEGTTVATREAVTAARTQVENRIAGAQGAIFQVLNTSQANLRGRIDGAQEDIANRLQNAQDAVNAATNHAKGELSTQMRGSQAATLQAVAASEERLRNAVTTAQNRVVAQIEPTSGPLGQLQDELSSVRKEIRAGHFNNAARLANKFASCCSSSIAAFRGIDNAPIPQLPATYKQLGGIREDISTILDRLGLDPRGPLLRKRRRLQLYMGLRR